MEAQRKEVDSSMIVLDNRGQAIPAFVAKPPTGGPHPGIVVLQEFWGLVDYIKDVASLLASNGYYAIVPSLFSRFENPFPQSLEEAASMMKEAPDDLALQDIQTAIDYLKEQPEVDSSRIGAIGFSMGGRLAFLAAAKNRELKSAVGFYVAKLPDEDLAQIQCPVLMVHGEEDKLITMEHVEQTRNALQKHDKNFNIITYPGAGHAFFNHTRPSYNEDASKDAWEKSLGFLNSYLNQS